MLSTISFSWVKHDYMHSLKVLLIHIVKDSVLEQNDILKKLYGS